MLQVAVSTIGFGDVVPKTEAETAYASCVVLLGALFYPAVVGAVMTKIGDSLTADAQQARR